MIDGRRRRVLLTGAAGFVGSTLARQLVADGHEVIAVVGPSTDRWRIRDIEARLSIVSGDLDRMADFVARIRPMQPEIAVHLAWRGWSGQVEADANLSSVATSLGVLRAMRDVGCRRFVSAGTCFEYDLTSDRLDETTPLAPHNLYGACKKAFYEVAQPFARMSNMSAAHARVFYSYGPFEDPRHLVPSIVRALLGGMRAETTAGEQVRDYLHVADIASAIWAVAQSDLTGAVNIASGVGITVAQVARRIGALVGRPELVQLGALPYRPGDPMRIVGGIERLTDELGWSPRYSLDDGLADTIAWWRRQEDVRRVS